MVGIPTSYLLHTYFIPASYLLHTCFILPVSTGEEPGGMGLALRVVRLDERDIPTNENTDNAPAGGRTTRQPDNRQESHQSGLGCRVVLGRRRGPLRSRLAVLERDDALRHCPC
jgi:hypothetical protein